MLSMTEISTAETAVDLSFQILPTNKECDTFREKLYF